MPSGLGSFLGNSKSILDVLGGFSSVLGKQQAGSASGKVTQAELQQRQDQNALANYVAQQNAQNTAANTDLSRKAFEQQNRGATAKQALIGALLGGGLTPTSVGHGGNISGGLLRSLNGNPGALAAMKLLGQQGATAQATPVQFQGGNMVPPPQLSGLPQVDNGGFLSTLARIGELAGAVSPYLGSAGSKKKPGVYNSNGEYVGE